MSHSNRTLLLSIPALTRHLLPHIPSSTRLASLLSAHTLYDLTPTWPAVTCSVQASLTTGTPPSEHGIIANGLPTYLSASDADLTDPANHVSHRRRVSFWEQSNQFLQRPRAWKNSNRKTALLFFQHCMPGFSGTPSPAADIVLTPKPDHGPDGKLTSFLWSSPNTLAHDLQRDLGPFPLLNYWGPLANLKSSQWIIAAATKVWTDHTPDLQLTYIPHLDYDLQRFGPRSPQAAKAVADLALALDPLLEAAGGGDATIIVMSEYAIDPVDHAIAPNRLLRDAGLLTLTTDDSGPCIDYPTTPAWVLCDHQIGHVYLHPSADRAAVTNVLTRAGIEVLSHHPIKHPRSGQLQIQAPQNAWLDYRWWHSDEPTATPTWSSTVDIHSKPGYDPLELFFNPATKSIQSDPSLIKGSHGRLPSQSFPLAILPKNLPPVSSITDLAALLR